MYITEKEIFSQYEALEKTYNYLMDNSDRIKAIFEKAGVKGVIFTGSGSSYSLCKSAELSTKMRTGITAHSLAAGDLMMNFNDYEKLIKDTILITPSRSGSTSEVVMAVKKAKNLVAATISICATKDSDLSQIVDLSLEIPWAFDESVCQTRTVTNLYFANLMIVGIVVDDKSLLEELKKAVSNGSNYMRANTEILRGIGEEDWEKIVVLGDSELEGIAEEGALAFKEISKLPSNYYHLLDVRHGPMVLIDKDTLVIAVCTPNGMEYQKNLFSDIKGKGARLITVSTEDKETWGSDFNIKIEKYNNYGVAGVPFIFVPQVLSLFKAISNGINPDIVEGLTPWIKLK